MAVTKFVILFISLVAVQAFNIYEIIEQERRREYDDVMANEDFDTREVCSILHPEYAGTPPGTLRPREQWDPEYAEQINAGVGTSAAGASFEQQQQFSTFGDIGQTDFEGFQFGMPEFNFQPAEPAQPAQTFDPNNMNNLFNDMENMNLTQMELDSGLDQFYFGIPETIAPQDLEAGWQFQQPQQPQQHQQHHHYGQSFNDYNQQDRPWQGSGTDPHQTGAYGGGHQEFQQQQTLPPRGQKRAAEDPAVNPGAAKKRSPPKSADKGKQKAGTAGPSGSAPAAGEAQRVAGKRKMEGETFSQKSSILDRADWNAFADNYGDLLDPHKFFGDNMTEEAKKFSESTGQNNEPQCGIKPYVVRENRMNLLWGKHILIDELPHDIKTKGPLTQSCFIVLSTPTKPKVPHDKEYPLTDEVMVGENYWNVLREMDNYKEWAFYIVYCFECNHAQAQSRINYYIGRRHYLAPRGTLHKIHFVGMGPDFQVAASCEQNPFTCERLFDDDHGNTHWHYFEPDVLSFIESVNKEMYSYHENAQRQVAINIEAKYLLQLGLGHLDQGVPSPIDPNMLDDFSQFYGD